MADVIIESITPAIIRERNLLLFNSCRHIHNPYGIVDPRQQVKNAKREGIVDTMVGYEKIITLATEAVEVRVKHQQQLRNQISYHERIN